MHFKCASENAFGIPRRSFAELIFRRDINYQAIDKVLLRIPKRRDRGTLGEQLNLREDIENVTVGAYVDSRPFIIIILRASTFAWLRLKSDLSVVYGISASPLPSISNGRNSWKIPSHLRPWTICFPFIRCPSLSVAFHSTYRRILSPFLGPLSPTLHSISSFLSATIIDSLLFRHGRFQ